MWTEVTNQLASFPSFRLQLDLFPPSVQIVNSLTPQCLVNVNIVYLISEAYEVPTWPDIFHDMWVIESNHGKLWCQCVSGWNVSLLLDPLMVYDRIEFERMSFPFLPDHALCDPTHTTFSFPYTDTHSTPTPQTPTQMKLTLWQLPVLMKRPAIQVLACLPGNLSHRCQGQKVAVCIPVFFLLSPSSRLCSATPPPPPCPETNLFKTPFFMLQTRQISSIRPVSNVFRWEHGERVSRHLLFLFSFVSQVEGLW